MKWLLSATLTLAVSSASAFEWREGVPLQRDGHRLTYDGRPFAAVGVNKHELLDQYIADLLGADASAAGQAREAARRSLASLQAIGVKVARVRLSAFWPAQIERTYLADDPERRERFWAALDQMLDDCDAAGIRIIATIAWHLGAWADLAHESLTDLYTNPLSKSRSLLHQWIRDLVGRYRQRDTILFWELTNEANLGADLRPQHPTDGVLGPRLERPAPHIVRGPVVRDGRNNYSSDELAALVRELCRLVKSIDTYHLVGTGFSAPRPAAWHMWLGSIRRANKMDWTRDSPEQQADYLRLISPEPLDLVSVHSYGQDFERIYNLKRAADSIGLPLYVGETGLPPEHFPPVPYSRPEAPAALATVLRAFRVMGIRLVCVWTWDEWGKPVHEPVLRPELHGPAVRALQQANAEAQRAASHQPLPADMVLDELRTLAREYHRLARGGG